MSTSKLVCQDDTKIVLTTMAILAGLTALGFAMAL